MGADSLPEHAKHHTKRNGDSQRRTGASLAGSVQIPRTKCCMLFLLAGKVLRNRRTRIFNGVAKLPRRITEDRIAVLIEHRNLVPMSYQALAAFMVKGHGVVRSLLVVRYRVLWASFIEGFDDLCRLRSCSTRCCTATGPVGGTPTSCDFPRLAVGHVHANFPNTWRSLLCGCWCRGRRLLFLSQTFCTGRTVAGD